MDEFNQGKLSQQASQEKKQNSEIFQYKPLNEFFEQYTPNLDRKGKQELISSTKKQTVGIFVDKKSKQRVIVKQQEFEDEKSFENYKALYLQLQSSPRYINFIRMYSGKEERTVKLRKQTYYILILVQERLRSLQQELEEKCLKSIRYTQEELQNLIMQLIQIGLELENRSLSHRNIKPQNLFFSKDKEILLSDFIPLDESITNSLQGTLEFIAPEIRELFIGNHDASQIGVKSKKQLSDFYRKADTFSLGIVIYCIASLYPHPPKRLNYCTITKKKVLKAQKRIEAIQEQVDQLNKTQDLRMFDREKMVYNPKTSQYYPRDEIESEKLGQDVYNSFKELFTNNYAQVNQQIIDVVLSMVQFMPNKRPIFQKMYVNYVEAISKSPASLNASQVSSSTNNDQKTPQQQQQQKNLHEEKEKEKDKQAQQQKDSSSKKELDEKEKQKREAIEKFKKEESDRREQEERDKQEKEKRLQQKKEEAQKKKDLEEKQKKDSEEKQKKDFEEKQKKDLEEKQKKDQDEQQLKKKKEKEQEDKLKEEQLKKKKDQEEKAQKELEEKKKKEQDDKLKEDQLKKKKEQEEKAQKELEEKKKKDQEDKRKKEQEEQQQKLKKEQEEKLKKDQEDKKKKEHEEQQSKLKKEQEEKQKLKEKELQEEKQKKEQQNQDKKIKDPEKLKEIEKMKAEYQKQNDSLKQKKENSKKSQNSQSNLDENALSDMNDSDLFNNNSSGKYFDEKKYNNLTQQQQKQLQQQQQQQQETKSKDQQQKKKKIDSNEAFEQNMSDVLKDFDKLVEEEQDKQQQNDLVASGIQSDQLHESTNNLQNESQAKKQNSFLNHSNNEYELDMVKATILLGQSIFNKTKQEVPLQSISGELNSMDGLVLIYEEFMQQGSHFFLDLQYSEAFIQIVSEILQDNNPQQQIEDFCNSCHECFGQMTGGKEFSFHSVKFFMPFQPNDFGISLLYSNNLKKELNFYLFTDPESDENMQLLLKSYVQIFQQLFQCEDWTPNFFLLKDQTLKYVTELMPNEPYMCYILLLFPLVYEKEEQEEDLIIEERSIECIYYISQGLKQTYALIEQKDEGYRKFFGDLRESLLSQNKTIKIEQMQCALLEGFEQELQNDLTEAIAAFMKEKSQKVFFSVLECYLGAKFTFSYYFYVKKNQKNKHQLGVFVLNNNGAEINAKIIEVFDSLESEELEVHIQENFPRHNGLYEYNDCTLPLWAYIVQLQNIEPLEAINLINFSMIPYYQIFASDDAEDEVDQADYEDYMKDHADQSQNQNHELEDDY